MGIFSLCHLPAIFVCDREREKERKRAFGLFWSGREEKQKEK